jgi:N-acetyl-S-(2-succino)cysteine monooxygenase
MHSARKMSLGILALPFGVHPAAWLQPDAVLGAEISLPYYVRLAQTAERGLFDLLFLADSPGMRRGNIEAFKRWPTNIAFLEPMTLLSALSTATLRLGLCATVSTSFFEPYNLARQFASLDHMSNGRAGWNVVTSTNPDLADNFHAEGFSDHATRYRRAKEFIEVVLGLWDSWDDDAFIRDQEAMIYFEPSRMHRLNHKGEFFSVRGPLNVPRSPQGRPVIIQAGGSNAGRELAAETAEVVFTVERTFEAAKELRDDLRRRAVKYGRSPDEIKVLVGLTTVIARTEDEAKEKLGKLHEKIHPDVGREVISLDAGNIDLSQVPVDQPVPETLLPTETERGKTYLENVKKIIGTGETTLKEAYSNYATSRGALLHVGTPEGAADLMSEWFAGGAADGFMLDVVALPTEFDVFVETVVPELQKRGLFRTAYEGMTLRENIGLARPESRYARG